MSTEDKFEYLKKFRDELAMSFLTDTLKKGKEVEIPSIGAKIVPLECGECEVGVKSPDGGTIICGPMLNGPDTKCSFGKGKMVEVTEGVSNG